MSATPSCRDCRFWEEWRDADDRACAREAAMAGVCGRRVTPIEHGHMSHSRALPLGPRTHAGHWCGDWEPAA